MTIVVDASVALKWVLEEEGSEIAERLVRTELLLAPDFIIVECGNALWATARRGILGRDQALAALTLIQNTPIQLFAAKDYVGPAQSLAFDLRQTVYDSLYLALALAEGVLLATADRRFANSINRHGVYRSSVRLLMDL